MAETDPGGVFLSYRREDTPHMAGRLADRLKDRFGEERVFMDVEALDPGVDFADAIETEVSRCDVMIVLIGTEWSRELHGTGQHRLLDPEDFVALEVGTALARGIRVIPVLVEGAHLPSQEEMPQALQPLLRRHAVRLDHDSFRAQVGPLIESVQTALDAAAAIRARSAEPSDETRSRGRIGPRDPHPSSEPERRLSHGHHLAPAAGSGRGVTGQTPDPAASGSERRPAPPEADAETVALLVTPTGLPRHGPVTPTSTTSPAPQVVTRSSVSRTLGGRGRRRRRRAVLAIVMCSLVLAGGAAWQVGRSDDGPTTTHTVVVSSETFWHDTGIDVAPGDRIRLTASGEIRDDYRRPERLFGPEGGEARGTEDLAPDLWDVAPELPHGALLGRWGSRGEAFLVGRSADLAARSGTGQGGRLHLTVNDIPPSARYESTYEDNEGSFTVRAVLTSRP